MSMQRSLPILSANRNKQPLAIDLTHPEGQKLICKLVAESDVVIQNFKVARSAHTSLFSSARV